MIFHSYEFIFLFLPITLLVFYYLVQRASRTITIWWLAFTSLFFYSYWDWRYLFLFLASIIFNFYLSNRISASKRPYQSSLVIIGITLNILTLVFFKYTDFIVQNINTFLHVNYTLPHIILPIGISFFTFTQIICIVDAKHHPKLNYRFIDYLTFVAFFPHLVAGPILRHNNIIPQLQSHRFGRPTLKRMQMGILFFAFGLFKKTIIADTLALYVDPLFINAFTLNFYEAWSAALLYTFQIYFDFSAYSDMAIGLALLINVKIPYNFNSPYKSRSMIEFWRRWHISLSLFLRDYLYIPAGGNRYGLWRQCQNILITMIIGGLWHGAAWTFVIWGMLHGVFLAINHIWRYCHFRLPIFIGWLLTFISLVISWVFFRSQSIPQASALLKTMFNLRVPAQTTYLPVNSSYAVICLALAWCLFAPNTQQYVHRKLQSMAIACMAGILLTIAILAMNRSEAFIYFQF